MHYYSLTLDSSISLEDRCQEKLWAMALFNTYKIEKCPILPLYLCGTTEDIYHSLTYRQTLWIMLCCSCELSCGNTTGAMPPVAWQPRAWHVWINKRKITLAWSWLTKARWDQSAYPTVNKGFQHEYCNWGLNMTVCPWDEFINTHPLT